MSKQNYSLDKVEEIKTVKDIIDKAVSACPNKICFKYKDNKKNIEVTYKEFNQDILSLGMALKNIGVSNKHIAVIGENSYKWLTVYLTMLCSNGVVVPVDKELPVEDIIHVLEHSDSEVLFFAQKYEKYIENIKKALPQVKYFIGFSIEEDKGNILSYKNFIKSGAKALKKKDNDVFPKEKNLGELRMLVYTSGTTGAAKGVMLSEENLVSCVYYGLQVSRVYTSCLSVLPYHHTYEAVAGILVGLHHHVTICINDSLKNILKNLQEYKPDYIYLVPAFTEIFYKKIWDNIKAGKKEIAFKLLMKLSNMLLKMGIDKRKNFFKAIHDSFGGNLRKIVCGGAPIRSEIGDFFECIGIDLINGYGITECSPLVSANRDNFNDCKTVGVVLPCCEVKFENEDAEGIGEICVKGKIVMLGYYKNDDLTQKVLKDGWFNTGDYGKMSNLGQLMITGRKKNLIVLDNGKNVFPEEIENYIMRIPYVQEVIVSGIKDRDGAEIGLCAQVFLSSDEVEKLKTQDIEGMVKKDISTVCRALPVYKKISKIVIRDKEFDKTTTNKIKR